MIVRIIGGLGNQMFQYAYAKALEQRGHEVKIDVSAFEDYKLHGGYQLDKYNIDLAVSKKEENDKFYKNTFFIKILRKIGLDFSNKIIEKNLLFDSSLLETNDDNYIEGYFQNEKYFKEIRENILKQFIIKQDISTYTKGIQNIIKSSKNSCSLHIRRGDFINSKNISIHGTCDIAYYLKAIEHLEEKVGNVNCFVFSDDIAWVKENLTLGNATYIESKEKRIPHEDIYLMSLCHHNIIANSSFSWWGAWLNQHEEKIVIAPKRWFVYDKMQEQSIDIVCENWMRI